MSNIKTTAREIVHPIGHQIMNLVRAHKSRRRIDADVRRLRAANSDRHHVFYLGITAHSNLGDMGQYYCIHNWILANFPESELIELEADSVVNKEYGLIDLLKREYHGNDIIIFQSGYTTQDLGGVHDLMHRMVIEALPEARILMMPQTVFFRHEENRLRSARVYNMARNMLFLARDEVSYKMALEMMPDVQIRLFPDIVTSLIGKYQFITERRGFNLCRRNDGEKFYSDEELSGLVERLSQLAPVSIADTSVDVPYMKLRANCQTYIERQIKYFSQFEAVITDRYHGTIYALAAGTPVVIIKTNDHKVVTGADWFKGVYDDYVYVAENLEDVPRIISEIKSKNLGNKLKPVFADRYYNNLKSLFETDK